MMRTCTISELQFGSVIADAEGLELRVVFCEPAEDSWGRFRIRVEYVETGMMISRVKPTERVVRGSAVVNLVSHPSDADPINPDNLKAEPTNHGKPYNPRGPERLESRNL